MENCIFCKIVTGEIPSYKISESEDFFAFLNIRGLKKGSVLIIPKKHIDYFFDLDDNLLKKILLFCKPISKSLIKAFHPKSGKVSMLLMGIEVPHAHLHLFPLDSEQDVDVHKAHSFSKEELEDTHQKILSSLD